MDNFENLEKEKYELEYSLKSEPIYRHLNLIFFRLFSLHNYGPEQKFDKNVWFLKNNIDFNKIINENKTPEGPSNDFFKILQDCCIGGKNLKTPLIEVKKFVNEISKNLFESNMRKQNAEEMVKHYKMDENKELIIDKIAKERQSLNFLNDITEIQFSIKKFENFPEGTYNVNLICEAFLDSESPLIQKEEINKKILKNKKIINNSNQTLDNTEYFEKIQIRNEKNYEYLNLEEVSLCKSKFYNDPSYIGILFNSYKFVIKKDDIFFTVTENETMIDNFITNLNILLKDKSFFCSSASFANIDKKKLNFKENEHDSKKYLLHYDLEVNFNKKTKLLILEKIYNIFYETITAKYDNEKIVSNFLSYFPEITKDILEILNEKKNINSEKCGCSDCLIY